MAFNATEVRRGMPVYGSDGKQVGCVEEVYGSEFGGGEPGTAPPHGTDPTGHPLPFLLVAEAGGLVGSPREVQIPVDVVQEIVPGERVVLGCTGPECWSRYG